jgi:hypothetical protein
VNYANCCLSTWGLAGLFTGFMFLSVQAAEYCMRPGKEDGTQADSVVCCSTPTGWEGWKDDLKHLARTKKLFKDPLTRALFQRSVWFFPSNCVADDKFRKKSPECSSLTLETQARDSRGQPDVEAGLRDFLDQLEQPQDLSPRDQPCVVVNRFGSFHTENSGVLTIWRIRCPSGSQHFVTLLAQRDVLVTIYLNGPDIKDIEPRLDSLKQLARSVRITQGTLSTQDIISINVRLPDSAIRDQLLQLTPLRTPEDDVYRFLKSPRFYTAPLMPERAGELHRVNSDFWMEIGHYSNPVPSGPRPKYSPPSEQEIRSQISAPVALPPTTVVRAFWKFDKERKLRDIEIQREVVEFKVRQ